MTFTVLPVTRPRAAERGGLDGVRAVTAGLARSDHVVGGIAAVVVGVAGIQRHRDRGAGESRAARPFDPTRDLRGRRGLPDLRPSRYRSPTLPDRR